MRGLDTYYGRSIEKIDVDSDGHWFVQLTGGVRVINVDGRRKRPDDLPDDGVGLKFANLIMDQGSTTMAFRDQFNDEWRVVFSALSYNLFDADQSSEPFAPQAGGYGHALEVEAPPEPTERLADGPTKAEEDMGDHVDRDDDE